ncbi:hypothetical protein LR48_Vigan221s001000 [Vigna angularis]|uniref:Uncharacterized protein n=1 Tax=Phaseolus angularis TaxID=3914 RepID=A0A0L9T646_PHAAN|nr:hypothetical protein LR48_Vigan221s001000 [Vigna angularis]
MEETVNQFIQKTESTQKSTEVAIKNLEIQMGQITKQVEEKPNRNFGANTEVNPREECRVVESTNDEIVELDKGETEEKRKIESKNTFPFPMNHENQLDFTELFKMVDNDAPWEQILQQIVVYTKPEEDVSTKKRRRDDDTKKCKTVKKEPFPLDGCY